MLAQGQDVQIFWVRRFLRRVHGASLSSTLFSCGAFANWVIFVVIVFLAVAAVLDVDFFNDAALLVVDFLADFDFVPSLLATDFLAHFLTALRATAFFAFFTFLAIAGYFSVLFYVQPSFC